MALDAVLRAANNTPAPAARLVDRAEPADAGVLRIRRPRAGGRLAAARHRSLRAAGALGADRRGDRLAGLEGAAHAGSAGQGSRRGAREQSGIGSCAYLSVHNVT